MTQPTIDADRARALLGRRDLTLADPVPEHPLLRGLPELGRGEYSIVLDKGDGERVYKLVSSPADYFFLCADDRPRGVHFPVLHADHGVIGRAASGYPIHLLEVEKLQPLVPGSEAARLAERIAHSYWEACLRWRELGGDMGRVALYHLTREPADLPPAILEALGALADFVEEYQIHPDLLGSDNLMMRADGTLILSDPVFIA